MMQVVEILPDGTQGIVYPTQSIPWLVMSGARASAATVLTSISWNILASSPGPNIKMTSYQYRKSHCGDKTFLRPSYLHNRISYTGKISSFIESESWRVKFPLTHSLFIVSYHDLLSLFQPFLFSPSDYSFSLFLSIHDLHSDKSKKFCAAKRFCGNAESSRFHGHGWLYLHFIVPSIALGNSWNT